LITEEFISTHHTSNGVNILPDDLILDWTKLSYGKGDQNPVDYVKFYAKYNDTTAQNISKNTVSFIAPEQFDELTLRVFAKDKTKIKSIQQAFRKALDKFNLFPDDIFTYPNPPPIKRSKLYNGLSRHHSAN